ncbi:recombinase family protein [Paracoccus homiensis]|uniref:Site-specific DNA recombinase n=1 Tax=Paracoccus homiensis TaxID=364199 RepID=A0A1I0J6Q7_9RHOB|nr:Site-specific DNA recombinase [Paracoccus homiensis]
MTAIVGYARTSTLEQVAGFEAQLRELAASGCGKMFREQVSSVASRPQLAACLDYLREGDTLVVTKLDRLARNVAHLGQLVATLSGKGVSLRILDLGLDTSTPTGELILNMMASVAQFERQMMLERQREGIAKAKADGKYKGRAPTAMRQALRARELAAEGLRRSEIAVNPRDIGKVRLQGSERLRESTREVGVAGLEPPFCFQRDSVTTSGPHREG